MSTTPLSSKKKLNILQFICPTGFYGAERWVLALANHLDPELTRCDLAVTLEDNSKDLEVVKQFNTPDGQCFEVPMAHKFDFKVVDRLVEIIKQREIDVIHTHGYKSDILGIWAARKAGIKVVVTPHGFENTSDIKLRLFIWLGCQSFRYADKVVPLSQQLMKDVRPYGIKPEKLEYIQNGVDLSEVERQKQCDIKVKDYDPNIKRIGFIGQMISRKNIKDILDIFENVASQHDNVRLYFLGDGESRPELEEYAKSLKHNAKIEFLGFRDDRLEWLQSFDLFVMTSTLEGIPRCVMETMAMGVPVAAYDIPGIDQLITNNETGLLSTLGDKASLEKQWQELLFDEGKAKKISEQAREYVYQHYSAQRMANEYMDLFNTMLQA